MSTTTMSKTARKDLEQDIIRWNNARANSLYMADRNEGKEIGAQYLDYAEELAAKIADAKARLAA